MYSLFIDPLGLVYAYNEVTHEYNPPVIPTFNIEEIWDVYEAAIDSINGIEMQPHTYDFYNNYFHNSYPTDIAFTRWCMLVNAARQQLVNTVNPLYRSRHPSDVRIKNRVFHVYWRKPLFMDTDVEQHLLN